MFKFKRRIPWVGLSLMMESDFFHAAQPLFEAGEVEVLEWSFDMGWALAFRTEAFVWSLGIGAITTLIMRAIFRLLLR
jgi:hypothetical protein